MDYGVLARSYNPLDYSHDLRKTLSSFYGKDTFDGNSKSELHKQINDALMRHYDGEEVLKYRLAKYFIKRNYIAAFEVRALDSRADFLVLNGDSKCFEIKSRIDTLGRLEKQVMDYSEVFEFNTIVIDQLHLQKAMPLLPEHCGIWTFEKGKRTVVREASMSPLLNPSSQLSLLTKRELMLNFDSTDVAFIANEFDSATINNRLKTGLKSRYQSKWSFVKTHWGEILPIDLQFFYTSNVNPEIIYQGC